MKVYCHIGMSIHQTALAKTIITVDCKTWRQDRTMLSVEFCAVLSVEWCAVMSVEWCAVLSVEWCAVLSGVQ